MSVWTSRSAGLTGQRISTPGHACAPACFCRIEDEPDDDKERAQPDRECRPHASTTLVRRLGPFLHRQRTIENSPRQQAEPPVVEQIVQPRQRCQAERPWCERGSCPDPRRGERRKQPEAARRPGRTRRREAGHTRRGAEIGATLSPEQPAQLAGDRTGRPLLRHLSVIDPGEPRLDRLPRPALRECAVAGFRYNPRVNPLPTTRGRFQSSERGQP